MNTVLNMGTGSSKVEPLGSGGADSSDGSMKLSQHMRTITNQLEKAQNKARECSTEMQRIAGAILQEQDDEKKKFLKQHYASLQQVLKNESGVSEVATFALKKALQDSNDSPTAEGPYTDVLITSC